MKLTDSVSIETNYSEYTVCVGNDVSNYGNCTREQAEVIANKLQVLIEGEFPEINVRRTEEIGAPTPTRGPEQDIVDEINQWVSENWTAVL